MDNNFNNPENPNVRFATAPAGANGGNAVGSTQSFNTFNPPYANPQMIKKPKKTYTTDVKDLVFLILSIISSVLLVRLGLCEGLNFGFSIAYSFLMISAFFYTKSRAVTNKVYYLFLFVLCLAFGASYSFNNDYLIKFLGFIFLMFLTFVTLNGFSGSVRCTDGGYMLVPDVLSVSIIKTIENVALPFNSFKSSAKEGKNKKVPGVLIGIVVSVPILCVIVPLLSSDAAFGNLCGSLLSDLTLVIVTLFFTIVFTPFLYSYLFTLKKRDALADANKREFKSKSGSVEPAGVNTVLIIISVTYIVYLFTQLAYISKAFAFMLPDNYTAAEFARDGFFQMAAVAFINLIIISVTSVIVKHKEGDKLPGVTKGLLSFLCSFTFFFICSALFRMAQYIEKYGLTRLRVLTSVFMIMLFVIFLVVLLRLFITRLPYMKIIIAICALTLLSISFTDINTVIAHYNYKEYQKGTIELDINQLSEMGVSALPELIDIATDSKVPEDVRDTAKSNIYDIANGTFLLIVDSNGKSTIHATETLFSRNTARKNALDALNKLNETDEYFFKDQIMVNPVGETF